MRTSSLSCGLAAVHAEFASAAWTFAVLECAANLGVRVVERPLPRAMIARASEVFLTSSIVGIRPVASIEGWWDAAGNAVPGPRTQALVAAYVVLVARECKVGRAG